MWDKFLMTIFLGGSGILIIGGTLFWVRRLANCININDKLMELQEDVKESNLYNKELILERLDTVICMGNKFYWYKVDEYIELKSLREYM